MNRCFSSLGCPDLSLWEMLALAERHELDGVELRALQGSTDVPARLRSEFGSPDSLARELRGRTRIPLVALGTSFRLIGADAAARAELMAFVPWAEALHVRWLRVFDGGTSASPAELQEAAATVAWWRTECAARHSGCDIIVETHDSLLTGERIAAFGAQAPGTAILWDSHHTWRRGGEDPVRTWSVIREWVRHVHVKDSVADATAGAGFRYVLPGEGEFPMADLRGALRHGGFDGFVSLEWERLWHKTLPPLEEALHAARTHRWW